MCWAHYQRWHRYGHPQGQPDRPGHMERIMARTSTPRIGCWLYETKEARAPRILTDDGRVQRVAVTVWEDSHGPVPPGARLVSLCRVRHCVNPDHYRLRQAQQAA